MYTVISWLIIVICIFLVIVVLVQNSKGGGLAQNFAGQQQIMGVRKTTDFLEKATWTLAASIMVLSFISVAFISNSNTQTSVSSELDAMIQNQQSAPANPGFATPEAPAVEMPAAADSANN